MDAKPILFVATANPEKSRQFYQETLGLQFASDHPYALVFNTGGIMFRIQKVEQVSPPPYTAIGWEVKDINQTVADLTASGVELERYSFLEQDDAGIWSTPEKVKVAWFKDPDGNLISLTQDAGS